MSVYTNIQAALDVALADLEGSISIAWPNTDFTPTHGTSYLEPFLLPISSTLETLNDYHRYAGIYQVNVSVPVQKGTSVLNSWLDSVHNLFLGEKRLTANGDTVFIQNIDRGPTQRDAENGIEYYRANIDVNFLVYT